MEVTYLMKKNFLKFCAVIICASVCIPSISGCAVTRQSPNRNGVTVVPQGFINPRDNTPDMLDLNPRTTGQNNRVTDTERNDTASPGVDLYDREKSEKIKSQLEKMQEIKSPNVIVTGDTAIVGCRPSNEQTDVSGAKNAVINKVKQTDPSIKNVLVSTSEDVLARIGTIINNLAGNRPAQDISEQLAKLMQDIMPAAR